MAYKEFSFTSTETYTDLFNQLSRADTLDISRKIGLQLLTSVSQDYQAVCSTMSPIDIEFAYVSSDLDSRRYVALKNAYEALPDALARYDYVVAFKNAQNERDPISSIRESMALLMKFKP